jgi:hypothetical protein
LLEDARIANTRIEEQRHATAAAAVAHEQMTDLVSRGGSVEDLARLAADRLDAEVNVLSPAGRVLFTSERDEPARAPGSLLLRQALSESRSLGRAVEVAGVAGRRVAAVTGGGELLGGLGIGRNRELAQAEVRILERAASVMSILLMARERAARYEHREINAFMAALLDGAGREDGLASEAARLGLAVDRPLVLMVAEEDDVLSQRGATELRRLLQGAPALVGGYDGRAVAIASSDARLEVWRPLSDVDAPAVAVSKPMPNLAQARGAYRRCLQLLRVAARLELRGRLAPEAAFGLFATLFDGQGAEDVRSFVDTFIAPFKARDRSSGIGLTRTLLTYLDNGHNVRRTAEALSVHLNTVRQRLEIAEGLVPGWAEPGRVLQVHAALRFDQLLGDMYETP